MTDHLPTDDDIEDAIERIETEEWEVTDWNLTGGQFEVPTVTFEVEYKQPVETVPRDAQKTVREIVEDIETQFDDGAPIEQVLEQGEDMLEIGRGKVEHELEKLKKQGEVYEPTADHLRTT